ncbi:hypothetical protein GCM10023206_29360 [Acinetobacter puyangensis]
MALAKVILFASDLLNKISGFFSIYSVNLRYDMIAIIYTLVILLKRKLQKIGYEMRRKKLL